MQEEKTSKEEKGGGIKIEHRAGKKKKGGNLRGLIISEKKRKVSTALGRKKDQHLLKRATTEEY